MLRRALHRLTLGQDEGVTATVLMAFVVGIIGGLGSLVFGWWIHFVREHTLYAVLYSPQAWLTIFVPVIGLLVVSWLTLRFAPEAQGHGVPEVIYAVARKGGVIRGRVAAIKTVASGLTIGTGGSVGREGPIVQIGSASGSLIGQWLRLPERGVKVLVASGAAAGISATFGAPLAGVMFAGEVILGNFAVSSLTPIVIAAVIANLVAQKGMYLVEPHRVVFGANGEVEKVLPVFNMAGDFEFERLSVLALYIVLGLLCGLAAVAFSKFIYYVEDKFKAWMPKWWVRAIVGGLFVGVCGLIPNTDHSLYGVGYRAVERALSTKSMEDLEPAIGVVSGATADAAEVTMARQAIFILLLLFVLKYFTTSVTLASGGSGGIFAPSLFLGAMLGGAVGQICAYAFPGLEIKPGAFSVVGMAAVVAGATHGPISAVLILFEMTNDYNMILPLMCAAGLAAIVAKAVDPESIYIKKLSRRGQLTAWSHHTTALEDVYVRDLMIRNFPLVDEAATVTDIVRTAAENPHVENLPVMGPAGQLLGLIRTEELHRILDSDVDPALILAQDVVQRMPEGLSPDDNLLDALRGFGTQMDVESLPVWTQEAGKPRLVGLLPRTRLMRRYRQEMLKHHTSHSKKH